MYAFVHNKKKESTEMLHNRLREFELAHIFSHKIEDCSLDQSSFHDVKGTATSGMFTCAANVVLLPKGTVRPTDNLRQKVRDES